MYARKLISVLLVAFCALSFVFAGPIPPPATDVLVVISPKANSVYKVGDKITVKIELPGGKDNILYKDNTPIDLSIQKLIHMPDLNEDIDTIPARTLAKKGFKFVVLEKYIIDTQVNIPWRVRAHFNHKDRTGYSDSRGFKLVKA
jgi:hypothetical protein